MIQSFAASERGFDEDAQVVLDLLLADIFAQELRAKREFDLLVVINRGAADQARFTLIIDYRWFFVRHNDLLTKWMISDVIHRVSKKRMTLTSSKTGLVTAE